MGEDEPFVIHPGEFCLGRTLEYVELPDDIVARIEGKSSLGRLGLIVHATAGFCDPGWKGTLTLELNNLTRVPIKLYPGLPIAQLSFMTLDAPARFDPTARLESLHKYQGVGCEATESRWAVVVSPVDSAERVGMGTEAGGSQRGQRDDLPGDPNERSADGSGVTETLSVTDNRTGQDLRAARDRRHRARWTCARSRRTRTTSA